MIDGVGLLFAAAGLAALAAALLPRVLGRVPISMPMVFVGAGLLVFGLVDRLPSPDPITYSAFTEHLTEVCVIIALMGAGLALNRAPSWRRWASTWRLLGITMPLSVIAVALLGYGLLGLSIAGAVLLAAALAPTDPVLASEVQVGKPADDPDHDDDEARFALTSEAGLNDGLAFPITYAAIAMAAHGAAPSAWLGRWLLVDVAYRTLMGVLIGLAAGWVLRKLFFSVRSARFRLAEHAEGFVALAATFLAYGAAELAQGYGFVAVFVCACTIRAAERTHGYHGVLHQYVEQMERLLTVLILLLLGGAIARGILGPVGWPELLLAALVLLVIRPLTGWLGLTGGGTGPRERGVIAFFGVRGVGSIFYVAYAVSKGPFPEAERIWSVTALVILGSVLLHGITATPAMLLLDRQRQRAADSPTGPDRASATHI